MEILKARRLTKIYGILRCIGLTRKQIIRMILSEALVTGIVGTFFGILVGHGF